MIEEPESMTMNFEYILPWKDGNLFHDFNTGDVFYFKQDKWVKTVFTCAGLDGPFLGLIGKGCEVVDFQVYKNSVIK